MTGEDKARAVHVDWRRGIALDTTDKDAIVHAICRYLRALKDCEFCPEWEADPNYGQVSRGCYQLAEEVMNICQTGHPHRKGQTPEVE